MGKSSDNRAVRVVDLFAGCGGLSLGFELVDGPVQFRTVMALDNDQSVVNCFNANHPQPRGLAPVAQTVDLTWFSHPSEILLHYLAHIAATDDQDSRLRESLEKIDYPLFLAEIDALDTQYAESLLELANSPQYKSEVKKMPRSAFNLAITKSVLRRMNIASLPSGTVATDSLPWHVQARGPQMQAAAGRLPVPLLEVPQIRDGVEKEWSTEIERLRDTATKVGRGQHSVVANHARDLLSFLESPACEKLSRLWVTWRTSRDATRANYCLKIQKSLEELYAADGRQVDLLLGGPPCKGFSRIARPVMASLRKQGVSAWTSHEFGDERNALMHQYVLYLRALRPKSFLFENVSNFSSVLTTPSGKLDAETALNEAIDELSNHKLSYEITSSLVNASNQGVPQDRRRFIMVGFSTAVSEASKLRAEYFPLERVEVDVPLGVALMGLDEPYEFAPGRGIKNPTALPSRTFPAQTPLMADSWNRYLSWVGEARLGKKPGSVGVTDAHVYRTVRADDVALLKRFGPGQRWMDYTVKDSQTLASLRRVMEGLIEVAEAAEDDRSRDLVQDGRDLLKKTDARLALRLILEQTERSLDEQHLLHDHYLSEEKGHGDWFERLPAKRPCKTIIAHIGKDTYSYFHPYENRAISIREAARVQSFPDSFTFGTAGIVEAYSMIGNAVPPLLSAHLAEKFSELHLRYGIFGKGAKQSELSLFESIAESG